MSHIEHEGTTPVKVFAGKELADEWLDKSNNWLLEKPIWLGDDDEQYKKYRKLEQEWQLNFPELATWDSTDYFMITEIEITTQSPEKE